MKKVLITGASGFVGSNVLEYLLKTTKWDFTAISAHYPYKLKTTLKNQHRVEIVVRNLKKSWLDLGKFDYILNFASNSSVEKSIKDPVNFIKTNTEIMLQVLEYARRFPPEVFLHFSTEEIYNVTGDIRPYNPYAASKAAQENIAMSYWNTYGVPVAIASSTNIVGKNQSPDKFVPKVIELIKAGKTVPIYTVNGRPGLRYWIPIDNVSDAIKYILSLPVATPLDSAPFRYELFGGELLDNLHMAKIIARLLEKNLKYELIAANNVRPGYNSIISRPETPRHLNDWKPIQTLEEGMSKWIN